MAQDFRYRKMVSEAANAHPRLVGVTYCKVLGFIVSEMFTVR